MVVLGYFKVGGPEKSKKRDGRERGGKRRGAIRS
jgi:hypothetical protein